MSASQVLITGGAGFVGSNLAMRLRKSDPEARIVALDSLKRRGSELNLPRLREAGVEFVHGDIRCPEDLVDRRLEPSVIIECSAEPSVLAGYESPGYVLNTNLAGTINCLEMARRSDAAVLFLSTSRVYPIETLNRVRVVELASRFDPEPVQSVAGVGRDGVAEEFPLEGARSLYGATKLCSELILREYAAAYGIRTVINRCGVIAGPWQMGKVDQGFCALWMAHHYFRKPLGYIGWGGTGKQVRDVLHIDDLVRLVELELKQMDRLNGAVFNAGGGPEGALSLAEASAFCAEITGNSLPISSQPENRPGDVRWYVTDNRRVTEATGWRPEKGPREILADIYDWIRHNESSVAPLWR